MSRKMTSQTPRKGRRCSRCDSTGWVCEDHSDRPWDAAKACGCGGAGMPCPSCNVSNADNPRRLPGGFHPDESPDGVDIAIVRGECAENAHRKDFTLSETVAIKRALGPIERAAAKQHARGPTSGEVH